MVYGTVVDSSSTRFGAIYQSVSLYFCKAKKETLSLDYLEGTSFEDTLGF